MLPVLVAKLHQSVVAAPEAGKAPVKILESSRQTRGTHQASIFLEQAGFKAMLWKQINRLTSAENAL